MEFKTVLQILLEADKEEPANEPDPTDYTDEPEPEPEDVEEDNEEETEPETEEDESQEEESETEDDPTDYTDTPTDDTSSEESPEGEDSNTDEEPPEEGENPHRKHVLMNDFVSLFHLVKSTQERVVAINFESIETNQIVIQVSNLLLKLKDELFDYITGEFKNDKYVMGVYKYNQALQSMNILIEVIRKAKVIKDDTTKGKKKR